MNLSARGVQLLQTTSTSCLAFTTLTLKEFFGFSIWKKYF